MNLVLKLVFFTPTFYLISLISLCVKNTCLREKVWLDTFADTSLIYDQVSGAV